MSARTTPLQRRRAAAVIACATALLAFTAAPARAQDAPAPGMWETVVEIALPGEKPRRITDSDCFTAKDRKDWQDAIRGVGDDGCKLVSSKRSGNTLQFVQRCGKDETAGTLTMHSDTRYTIVAAQPGVAGSIKIEARRTAASCK